ncbi:MULTISPECIES: cytochrome c oxidase subunit 4 [unclassified Streptomyces]|uniref:aa3-type cytochrome oxidase subunit IV n=1 Tax=unclassified Streptomyces TaxID=2593676 RepID=UPI002E160501|nr:MULTISPECIES: cytochrome c oxidase subunit 4 [unclassified Streptomyces]WSR22867.1 cytochrome c oxidase subunit 4 [Streptomyces sp. NBC_01205]
MKAEAWLFSGVAVFFAVTGGVYAAFSTDPAGVAALSVSFLMSALVAAFLWRQYGRGGRRPEDTTDAEIRAGGDRRFSFPASSFAPVTAATGTALMGIGAVQGLWLVLIGAGVVIPGLYGFVFRPDRDA